MGQRISIGGLYDKPSDPDVLWDEDNANLALREANIVLPKESGFGIQIDAEEGSNTWAWRDIIGRVQPKATGAGSPARAVYIGGQLGQYAFIANDLYDMEFHIPHDIVPGTDLYFHVHWSHNDPVSIIGNAVFSIYYTYSKGHNQDVFAPEKTQDITWATTSLLVTPQYKHRIDEVAITGQNASATLMDRDTIEVDGIILATLKLNTLPTFGGAGKLFVHTCDIHYQSTNVGTKQKAPDFYV